LAIAVPLTTRDRGLSHHVVITGDNTGLDRPTWALCEQVRAVSTARLIKQLGTADPDTLKAVRRVIAIFLEL
jgi:mRNA interferase MazF